MNAIMRYYNFFADHGPFSSPLTFIETIIVLLLIALLLIFNKEKWTTKEKVARIAIWFYLYLIFLFTCLSRSPQSDFSYKLIPFWSYKYIASTHDFYIVLEVVINSLMFVPIGILAPWVYRNYLHENQKKERNRIILFGLIISISVECIQLFTKTGYFEWDDIMHNIIGLIVGYGFYLWLRGKRIMEVHRYFMPLIGVGLALLIAVL